MIAIALLFRKLDVFERALCMALPQDVTLTSSMVPTLFLMTGHHPHAAL